MVVIENNVLVEEKTKKKKFKDNKCQDLLKFLDEIKFNNLGIITLIKSNDFKKILNNYLKFKKREGRK